MNIRRIPSAELGTAKEWIIPADRLFNKLTYSNLMLISAIDNPVKRAFYEMETIRGCWSYKELERQIASLYYERSGLSKNTEALSALVQQQATLLQPKDVINTPVTLEFLGLNEHALVTENDLEQSILDNLQHFLLEMGHGFCFETRQKRILIDEDYFFTTHTPDSIGTQRDWFTTNQLFKLLKKTTVDFFQIIINLFIRIPKSKG